MSAEVIDLAAVRAGRQGDQAQRQAATAADDLGRYGYSATIDCEYGYRGKKLPAEAYARMRADTLAIMNAPTPPPRSAPGAPPPPPSHWPPGAA